MKVLKAIAGIIWIITSLGMLIVLVGRLASHNDPQLVKHVLSSLLFIPLMLFTGIVLLMDCRRNTGPKGPNSN